MACVLGSSLMGLDATLVPMALPSIGRDLGVSFAVLQWTVTGYTLTLAALILLGGALGDRYGRRRVFLLGIVVFGLSSLACALAPGPGWLVGARVVEGVGAALVTPGSLAIQEVAFRSEDRAEAIGAWSGWAGASAALAPFLGGWLLHVASWRWVFVVGPVAAVLVLVAALAFVPESRDETARGSIDLGGAVLVVAALAGLTTGGINAGAQAFDQPAVWVPLLLGIGLLGVLTVFERRPDPLLPVTLFGNRQFSAANAVTLLVYAANGGTFFLVVLALQVVAGFSPLLAGSALLPVSVVMLLLAARAGRAAQRWGPRWFLAAGPVLAAGGVALLTRLSPESGYLVDVLPAMVLLGVGLAVLVAPLTATVLAAAPPEKAGTASGVNNAVARTAGLLAVAVLPALVGIGGSSYDDPTAFLAGFRPAMAICAALLVAGGVLAAAVVRNPSLAHGHRVLPALCTASPAHPTPAVSPSRSSAERSSR